MSFDLAGITDDIDITMSEHRLAHEDGLTYVCESYMGRYKDCKWTCTATYEEDAVNLHRKHVAEEIVVLLAQWGDIEAGRR